MPPSMNFQTKRSGAPEEFLCFFEIWYFMEVQKLHEEWLYLDVQKYSKIISRHQFEDVFLHLKFSAPENQGEHIIDFLYAVSTINFKKPCDLVIFWWVIGQSISWRPQGKVKD